MLRAFGDAEAINEAWERDLKGSKEFLRQRCREALAPEREERREPKGSEGQVLSLSQQRPVSELLAECEAAVLRGAEDIESLVVYEPGGSLPHKEPLDGPQVPGP